MAALLLLVPLLVFGGASGGDDGAGLPRLEFRGVDLGRGQASDAPSQGFMDLMSKNGCRGFAGLVAATANAGEIFQERVADGGLTVFCPDDKAVAAFEPAFKNLSADGQVALLLYHGVGTSYTEKALRAINRAVETLATGGANKSYNLTIRDNGDTVELSPSPSSSSRGVARVTKTVADEGPLAVYLIDAVLLPCELLLDGWNEVVCSGFMNWLHCCIPVWAALCCVLASMAGLVVGILIGNRGIH